MSAAMLCTYLALVTVLVVQVHPAHGDAWLTRDTSWVVDANGNGNDASEALDGDAGSYWNPVDLGQNYNNWYMVLNLAEPYTLTRIAVTSHGDTTHDVSAFKLQKSLVGSPYNWEDVVSVTNVQGGTRHRQELGGFHGTARHWRFLVTRTHSGWQPWLNELELYGIALEPGKCYRSLTFPEPRAAGNYARLDITTPAGLVALTACVQLRTTNTATGSVFSYASQQEHNEIMLWNNGGSSYNFIINGIESPSTAVNLDILDGKCHMVCGTWESQDGRWAIYVDGIEIASASGLAVGHVIRTPGVWILAQEQDSMGGAFDAEQAYSGDLSCFNVWDRVLSPLETVRLRQGNVFDWTSNAWTLHGEVSDSDNLCDVNVALGKTAFQTSTVQPASFAVDGNTNTYPPCTHTTQEANPSWWVDLGQSYLIDRVAIFNRQDCCSRRLNPFNIHIGDSDRVSTNPKCGGDHQIDLNQPMIQVECKGMRGRYVGVRLPSSYQILSLCEVQVFIATKGYTVRAQSSGFEDPGFVYDGDSTYIVSNGEESRINGGVSQERGNQVFILNERTGEVINKTAFDTHGGGAAAAGRMETFLEGVAEGRIIVIVVHDTGGTPVDLAPYGSTITQPGLRESYAMITQKGTTPSWFVEKKSARGTGPTIVEAFILSGTCGLSAFRHYPQTGCGGGAEDIAIHDDVSLQFCVDACCDDATCMSFQFTTLSRCRLKNKICSDKASLASGNMYDRIAPGWCS
ncbi:uncharacterized protein [Branchiostoma lanceolatum]|uniref:uncharacterized protein n=1 Tax=Branchiostoma lanceolatum TaxID=7740 RepID=UPI003452F60E